MRARLDIALLVIGAVVQIGSTILAARHQVERRSLDVIGIGLLTVGLLALPFRHRRPVAVLAFVFSATLAYWASGYPRGPVFFALVSFCPTSDLMPRLSNERCSSLLTSGSSFGTRRGRYSTIVTSTPSAL